MLAEYLNGGHWEPVAPGVEMYTLPVGSTARGQFTSHLVSAPRIEAFFCSSGSCVLRRRTKPDVRVGAMEIVLISDFGELQSIDVTEPVSGRCLSIDPAAAKPVLTALYGLLGRGNLLDDPSQAAPGGCLCVHNAVWNQSVFIAMGGLPPQEQGRYCMMKAVELIYLLGTQRELLDSFTAPLSGYTAHAICGVRDYMEGHLDEKLTISALSRRFHMSSTALKGGFRALYGQSIHSWLQERRIHCAAELLRTSDMTVLQIAQSVGYEGVSQFNVVFRKMYGTTPSHYRKMPISIII